MNARPACVPDMRSLALDVLIEVLENGRFSQNVLGGVLSKYQYLEKRDRSFLTRLVDGTLDYCIRLDYCIDLFASVKTKRQKPVIRNILRLSVFQLLFMDSVPDRAVINEAVTLAKKRGFSGLSGFVNAVLRKIAANKDNISYPPKSDEVRHLSVMYSAPEWLAEEWNRVYGFQKTGEMLSSFLEERPLTVHINTCRTNAGALKSSLLSKGIDARAVDGCSDALTLDGYDSLNLLEEFRDGLFWVQDKSSILAVDGAGVREGDFCVDVCAAPGGKTFCLAALTGEDGTVESGDLTEKKTSLITDGIERLGFKNIRVKCHDARTTDPRLVSKADLVLADLPCSGLGVLGKKPDLKYRMDKGEILKLQALQREILLASQPYVKEGGRLLYCTCTVSREENEDNVDWFLGKCPSFELVSKRQILPGDGMDGFFTALFKRADDE